MFELSVTNVDKPALPSAEICRRLRQFTWRTEVWVTRAPTFAEKASVFPGAIFVVGADTAERILGRLDAQLEYAEMSEILSDGLPSYIQKIRTQIQEAALAVQKAYFLH